MIIYVYMYIYIYIYIYRFASLQYCVGINSGSVWCHQQRGCCWSFFVTSVHMCHKDKEMAKLPKHMQPVASRAHGA